MCRDNSYSCPPSRSSNRWQTSIAAGRSPSSHTHEISHLCLAPSLTLLAEGGPNGWDVAVTPVLTVRKRKRPQKYMGLLRLSLVLPLGNSPFPWYVVPPDDGHCHFVAEEEDRRLLCRPTQFKVTPHWGHGKYGGYVEQLP